MKVLTNNQYYSQIANVIREQNGTNNTYTPPQMVNALKDLFYEEVEGVPPINFQGIGENLLDYRIFGASGGVGDRTGNLFDEILDFNKTLNPQGNSETYNGRYCCHNSIDVSNISSCTISWKSKKNSALIYALFDNNNQLLSRDFGYVNPFNLITNNAMFLKIGFLSKNESIQKLELHDIYDVIVNEGSTAMDYEPYGYKVPVVISGKNLFDETQVPDKSISTETSNYQIFKQNGKLTINGMTTTAQADTEISNVNGVNNQALDFINNNAGNYIFTSSVPGRIMIRYKLLGSDVVRYTFDEYNSSNRVADRIMFRLQQNYQYNNEQMNIMFRLKQIQSQNYEPYHEPIIRNIYLDEPIEENESISLSDTNVNIPTIKGTNVLTVDTTVQPSNVYVKSRHESSHEAQIRQLYESVNAELTQYKAQYGELGGE